jgi:PAS domain S-box-containing protein
VSQVPTAAGNVKILLVEDDPDDFLIVKDLVGDLDGWNPELTWVSTYDEALQAIESGAFDVVVAGYELGVRYGVELIKEQRVRVAGVPVIVMAAQGRHVDLEAAAAGAADYLHKGEVTALALERAVRYAVESARRSRSERRFRALIEQSGDLVTVLDEEGTVLYAGGAVRQLLGVEPAEAVGRSLWELVAGPEGADELRTGLAAAVDAPGELVEGEMRVHAGGVGARHIEYSVRSLLHDPEVLGVVLTARDCTDRVERERRIRVQAELLDRVGHVVLVVDGDFKVTYWNRAAEQTFGWSWDEVRGQQLGPKIVPGGDSGVAAIRAIVARDGLWEGEIPLLHRDGREVIVLGSVVPAEEPEGSRIAAGVDVTELRRAQRQLTEHRGLLETVVASAPVVLFALDAEGTFTLSQGEGLGFLDLSPGQLVGESFFALYADRPELLADARRALAGERLRSVREMNGRVIETWWSTPNTGPGTIGVSVDVTEQRRAEEQKERLLTILDSTPDFVGIATVDQNVTHLNPAGRRMVGLPLDVPLAGVRIADLHPPRAMKRLREEAFPTAISKGTWSGESALKRIDGSEIPIWQVVVAHRSEAGEVVFFSTVASDLTEWKQATEQLSFQSRLLDAVGQAVIGTDLDGSVTYWNRAAEELYGWSAEEVIGSPMPDLMPADPMPARTEQAMAFFGRDESWTGEIEAHRKDGATFPALVTNAPIRDESGDLVGVVGVSSDLSKLKTLEAELRQAQKMEAVGRLAGGVAHDFNNLLTVVQLHLQLLLEAPGGNAALVPDLMEIQSASRRAAELTKQLLAFGRKQVFEERVVDLRDEVRGMGTMLRRLVPESIALDIEISARPSVVKVDPTQVQQVLLNLVVNAIDALEGRGEIQVQVDRTRLSQAAAAEIPWRVAPGDYVRVTVRDTGVGMDEEVMARIFEPFFTTKEQGKGTGLGLASVYGIVKQSEGHIFVESIPGEGTVFRVLFPAVGPDSSRAETAARNAEDGPRADRGSGTILIVEDDKAVRNVAVRVLESQGYEVVTATNGKEALEIMKGHPSPIALVVTDIVMPEMGGVDLARQLRRDRPEIPVVLMSGYPREESGVDVAEFSVAFLAKPFTVSELLDTVRGALQA